MPPSRAASHRACLCALALAATVAGLAPVASARADEAARVHTAEPRNDRNYVNFRIGATSAAGRAQLCLEGAPHALVGLEACGTGATWFHNSDETPQLMHLRGNFRVGSYRLGGGYLQPRLSLGVTELQVGEDAGGLDFTGTGPFGVETAGPEVGGSLRWLRPIAAGFELIGQLDASLSYLKHAPKMVRPQPALLPVVTATLGFGF